MSNTRLERLQIRATKDDVWCQMYRQLGLIQNSPLAFYGHGCQATKSKSTFLFYAGCSIFGLSENLI